MDMEYVSKWQTENVEQVWTIEAFRKWKFRFREHLRSLEGIREGLTMHEGNKKERK